MGRHYDLVIFDMDGVLTRDRSSWTFVHDMMGVSNEHNLKAFIEGRIDEDEFIRSDIALWKGVDPDINIRKIARFFRELRLIDGIQETVACLHYSKIRCVICSGGIDLAAKMISDEYGFDELCRDCAAHPLMNNNPVRLDEEALRRMFEALR